MGAPVRITENYPNSNHAVRKENKKPLELNLRSLRLQENEGPQAKVGIVITIKIGKRKIFQM